MPQITMLQALNDAMHIAMERDDDVVMLGEDIGRKGGVFGTTAGLWDKYGDLRVMDTPLSECGIIGTAVGMALAERLQTDAGSATAGRQVGSLSYDPTRTLVLITEPLVRHTLHVQQDRGTALQ